MKLWLLLLVLTAKGQGSRVVKGVGAVRERRGVGVLAEDKGPTDACRAVYGEWLGVHHEAYHVGCRSTAPAGVEASGTAADAGECARICFNTYFGGAVATTALFNVTALFDKSTSSCWCSKPEVPHGPVTNQCNLLVLLLPTGCLISHGSCGQSQGRCMATADNCCVDASGAKGTRKPIRIQTHAVDKCTGPACRCTAVGDRVSDFRGTMVTCTAEDVVTEEKGKFLEAVIDEAVDWLQQAIKVTPLPKLDVVVSVCGANSTGVVEGAVVPSSHRVLNGTDLVIYTTAVPAPGKVQAWAVTCQVSLDWRPTAALINFSPSMFVPLDKDKEVVEYSNAVNTAIHELMHVLGFSSEFFGKEDWFPGVQAATVAAGGVVNIVTPKVLEKAREHFACPELQGVPLENQGGDGTALSHWEKRVFGNEAMTGVQTNEGTVISAITLAYFEDTGVYDVDYTMAGDLLFGKGQGCGFLTEPCNKLPGPEFCFGGSNQCTSSLKGLGSCNIHRYSAPLPKQYQYFDDPTLGGSIELADYCPFHTSALQCTDQHFDDSVCYSLSKDTCELPPRSYCKWGIYQGNIEMCASIYHDIEGMTFGNSSRCFNSDVDAIGWSSSSGRCFKVTCAQDSQSYSIEVGLGTALYCGNETVFANAPKEFRRAWHGRVPCHTPSKLCDGSIPTGHVAVIADAEDEKDKPGFLHGPLALALVGGAIVLFVGCVLKCLFCAKKSPGTNTSNCVTEMTCHARSELLLELEPAS